MNKEIMKGSIDILVLSLIKKRDTYGYEIAKSIKEKSDGVYLMGEGTLYPALKRLESKGFIESYWQESELTGRRKYYKITMLGKEELDERIAQWNAITKLIRTIRE